MKRKTRWGIAAVAAASFLAVNVAPAFAATHKVQAGQSLWSIAKSAGVTLGALEAANPSANPANLPIGATLTIPSGVPSAYVVQPGDTLWTISQQYHLSVNRVEAVNTTVNALNLLVGTTIHLPGTSDGSSNGSKASSTSTTTATSASSAASTAAANNLYWMEHVINAEAGAESLKTQIAVGDVILHRLANGDYGNTVKDVVFQISDGHYQFTSVANGYIYTAPCAQSIQAAKDVLQQDEDVVPGAFVFYNPAQTPASSWVRLQPTITQIGDLVFAK